jgi:hypothetical protein
MKRHGRDPSPLGFPSPFVVDLVHRLGPCPSSSVPVALKSVCQPSSPPDGVDFSPLPLFSGRFLLRHTFGIAAISSSVITRRSLLQLFRMQAPAPKNQHGPLATFRSFDIGILVYPFLHVAALQALAVGLDPVPFAVVPLAKYHCTTGVDPVHFEVVLSANYHRTPGLNTVL